ncbi:MAG: 4-chlorobenzoyl coenzyme A dehalogenase-2 [Nitrosomonadaceae bacterium]|nr:4-chlorobenzoyl coenzyme A dehalogenase-2 [Nitrosomonadaceae bacterium]
MMSEHVEVSRDGAVLVVRFVNEQSRNSMTAEFRAQLGEAVIQASQDPTVRSVYLTGQGAAFCAGGDLHMLKDACEPWAVHRRFRALGAWFLTFLQLDKPVIVGVNGAAVGGGMGIALAGDLIVASENAKFISGFFRLGVVPDVGTMYMLPRLIGLARAKRFLFGNETLSAKEAYDIGLVSKVVPPAELDAVCLEQARAWAEGPATVMGLSKLLLARSFETGLNEMFLMEGLGQALGMSSGEFREGLSAMLEKRPAEFINAGNSNGGQKA